jgi:hypothetical protein
MDYSKSRERASPAATGLTKPLRAFCSVIIFASALFACSLFADQGLQIDKAFCGAEGSWRDVTAFVQSHIESNTLSVEISQPFEEIGGDPAFGKVKQLLIDYRFRGKPFRLLLEEQFPTAFTITLPSADAVPPGADPRASEMMAKISAQPGLAAGGYPAPLTKTLLLAMIVMLLTLACSVVAAGLALPARPRHLGWSAGLAVAAALVSTMGLTAWTPFGFFPEIGYAWSNGRFEVSVRSGWLFLVPLLVATAALALAAWKRRTRVDAA